MISANSGQHAKHIKTLSAMTEVLPDKLNYQEIINAETEKEVYDSLVKSKFEVAYLY